MPRDGSGCTSSCTCSDSFAKTTSVPHSPSRISAACTTNTVARAETRNPHSTRSTEDAVCVGRERSGNLSAVTANATLVTACAIPEARRHDPRSGSGWVFGRYGSRDLESLRNGTSLSWSLDAMFDSGSPCSVRGSRQQGVSSGTHAVTCAQGWVGTGRNALGAPRLGPDLG